MVRNIGSVAVVPVVLLAGCAAGGTYRGGGSANTYIDTVPPAFRGLTRP